MFVPPRPDRMAVAGGWEVGAEKFPNCALTTSFINGLEKV
jgi:hypothetical protein